MKYFLIPSVFLTLITTSCRKDSVNNNNTTLLLKFVLLDTTKAAPNDTIAITNYSYDNLNRVTSELNAGLVSTTNNTWDTTYSVKYFYIGNNILAYKMITNSLNSDFDTIFHFYNTQGKFIHDSVSNGYTIASFPSGYYEISNYSLYYNYTNNIVQISQKNYSPENFYSFQNIQNNNTTEETDTINQIVSSYTITYDNNVNPFYQVAFHSPTLYSFYNGGNHDELSFDENMFTQKNNSTEVIINSYQLYTTPPTPQIHIKRIYQYNSNGYPAYVWTYDILNPGNPPQKGIYIYTN